MNRFSLLKQQLSTLPAEAQEAALTTTMQRLIPIIGTLGVVVNIYEVDRCVLHLPNAAGVQNGWGGIQAGGIYTTAESAMAFVIGANLTDDRLVVARTVTMSYGRKAQGGITATATLSPEQIQHICETEKGELTLECPVVDETGTEVSRCRAEWVWHPIRRG